MNKLAILSLLFFTGCTNTYFDEYAGSECTASYGLRTFVYKSNSENVVYIKRRGKDMFGGKFPETCVAVYK